VFICRCIYILYKELKMGSKTISVTEDVYNLLCKMKLPGESFGDTIRRLCKPKTTTGLREWMESSKGWSDLSKEEVDILEKAIDSVRKSLSAQEVDL
jgi:predicted CopG family antitoxin